MVMEELRPWTDDEATRFFSGVATYEKEVAVPEEMLRDGLGVQLDFGPSRLPADLKMRHFFALIEAPVREAAVVYVNDRRAGSVWHPPYAVDEVHRVLVPGGRFAMTVWGDVKKSPGGWMFTPFRWATEAKVRHQADMVALGRPGIVNGAAGVIVGPARRPRAVVGFTVARGRILAIDLVLDREKLRGVRVG